MEKDILRTTGYIPPTNNKIIKHITTDTVTLESISTPKVN